MPRQAGPPRQGVLVLLRHLQVGIRAGSGKVCLMRIEVFSFSGCAGCHTLQDMLADMGMAYEKVDIARNPERSARHSIMTAPSLVINGKLVHSGVPSRERLQRMLREAAAS